MTARVVRVESDSDTDPTWQITVTREVMRHWVDRPSVHDVPSDIRAALREWLEGVDQ